jgi:predicted nucleotidyltransferase
VIEKFIKNIGLHLDQAKIPYMIIGGQAVLIYGRPRMTRDIDITLGIDTDKFAQIDALCRRLKLKPLAENSEAFAQQTRVFPVEDTGSKLRIDFIFSFTPYETQAIQKSNPVQIDGYPVKFASCEDVVIHKMIAGRAIDEEDIKSILVKNRSTMDFHYIEKWLSDFDCIPECEGILLRWNNLIRSTNSQT